MNAVSTQLDRLYGQPDTIYGIGMSIWTHATQTDTISTPYDSVQLVQHAICSSGVSSLTVAASSECTQFKPLGLKDLI